MEPQPGGKPYDLEERTYQFARHVREFFKRLPRTLDNVEDGRQVIRASGSIGSNYIEANEALGKKDFLFHVRVSRKESKESRFYLRLDTGNQTPLEEERAALVQESTELMNIFGAILRKSQ